MAEIGIQISNAIPDGMVVFMLGQKIVRIHMPGSGPVQVPHRYHTIHISPTFRDQWLGKQVQDSPPQTPRPRTVRRQKRARR